MKKLFPVLVGLLVVATSGYAPGRAAEPQCDAKTITVKFVLFRGDLMTEEKLLRKHHKPIRVSVDCGDQIVWEGINLDAEPVTHIKDFTVTITPTTPNPPHATFYTGETKDGKTKWSAKNGRVETGSARLEARGHRYESTIEALGKELDPHIIFY